MTAEPAELACQVTNITNLPPGGRLGVTWEHTTLPGTSTSALIKIFYDRLEIAFFFFINILPHCFPSVLSTSGIGDDPHTLHDIGSLDGNGNLLPGPMYSDRLRSGVMSLTRVQPDTFKLRILRTQVAKLRAMNVIWLMETVLIVQDRPGKFLAFCFRASRFSTGCRKH